MSSNIVLQARLEVEDAVMEFHANEAYWRHQFEMDDQLDREKEIAEGKSLILQEIKEYSEPGGIYSYGLVYLNGKLLTISVSEYLTYLKEGFPEDFSIIQKPIRIQ